MKKLILYKSTFIIALLFLLGSFKYSIANTDTAVKLIKRLYKDYRNLSFGNIASYSTGAMQNSIYAINRFLLEAPAKKIETFKARYRRLWDLRIYDSFSKSKYVFVYSLWIYKSPPDTHYKYKIDDIVYLLEKVNKKLFIRNSRFIGQHIIHDIKKVRNIQRQARNQAYQRYRRRYNYRR